MNLREAARAVTLEQQGKTNLSIAQVTQVLGEYHELMAGMSAPDFVAHQAKVLANGKNRLKRQAKKK